MNSSWKTTTGGAVTILIAILGAVQAMIDNNPATNPDWTAVIAAITAGGALLFARDHDVTSEQAGAK